jgi:hypothetical protein
MEEVTENVTEVKVEKAINEEIENIERQMGQPEIINEGSSTGGESTKNSGYNLSLVDLLKRAFPSGLSTAAAYPRKAVFKALTVGLDRNDVEKISPLSETDGALLAIKTAILESLVEEYGHIKVDARLAFLAVEVADDVPMALQVLEFRKNLKQIDDHVKGVKSGS